MRRRGLKGRLGLLVVCLVLGVMGGGCLVVPSVEGPSPDTLLADFGEAMISEDWIRARDAFAPNGMVYDTEGNGCTVNAFLGLWYGLDVERFDFDYPAQTAVYNTYTEATTTVDVGVSDGTAPLTGRLPVKVIIVRTSAGNRIQELRFRKQPV